MGLFDFFKKKAGQDNSTQDNIRQNSTQSNTSQSNNSQDNISQGSSPVNSVQGSTSQNNSAQSNSSPEYNSTPNSNIDDSLEVLLQRAATDPACRSEFYRRLLMAELFVISKPMDVPAGTRTMQEGDSIEILSLNDGRLPIFTSSDRIYDKGIVTEQVHYIKAPGKELFNLTKGATLVLNPFSDYGKELVPDEIASLLQGTIFQGLNRQVNIPQNTEVLVGQPNVYPTAMVNAVVAVAKTEPLINAVYMAYMQFKDSTEPPHFVFSIDAGDGFDMVKEKVGITAQRELKPGEVLDVIKFGTTLHEYFSKVEPFYKR